MNKHDRLYFGTAGIPLSCKGKSTREGLKKLSEIGLDALELEYVRGTFPGDDTARQIARAAQEYGIALTAHGPYFINLNADDPEKRDASRQRVIKTARSGSLSGAESITFHAGFYLKHDPDKVYNTIREELETVIASLHEEYDVRVDVRPETTGKPSQFGSLDEILRLSKEVDCVAPCIDWAHLHAKNGKVNTAGEFKSVLDRIRNMLGENALKNMHMHIAGIDYGPKGERKHLNLDDSDMNYRALLHVLKENEICGVLICESPSLEDDALKVKEYYDSLS